MKPWLQVSYSSDSVDSLLDGEPDTSDSHVLGVFDFGGISKASRADSRLVHVPLEQLNGSSNEVWTVSEPVSSGVFQQIQYNHSSDLSLAQISIEMDSTTDIEVATRDAYRQILKFLEQHQHPWPLKIWHYFPSITAGDNDDEQYRLFCAGRAYAIGDNPVIMTAIPAATAIGSKADQPRLLIYFLAGEKPGKMVENPRQIPPSEYPRQYGIRSPLFSRGTLIDSGKTHQFLISGTASIIGHQSLHEEDVRKQTRESLRNLTALISAGRRLAPVSLKNRQKFIKGGGVLRIYVKQQLDLDLVRDEVSKHPLGKLPAVYLQGDICRNELLVEIDGIF
jgi:chorismate lyase/3-hydroxybenzoate synthase